MIEVTRISKSFDDIKAIDSVNARIEEGHVFGLVGTNGAGKSTFMRMLSGVLKPEAGMILIDGEPVYDNPASKEKIFYISDDQFFSRAVRRETWSSCTGPVIRPLTGRNGRT